MHNLRRSISSFALTWVLAIAAALLLVATPQTSSQRSDSFLIFNAQLADGTGAPLREGALRIHEGHIVSIGKLSPTPGERVLDAHGLVLSPGFIDIHNHSLDGLDADPLAETQIAQGITTAVQGPDGESPWPIADWIAARRKNPAAMNVAVLAGHATIREQVMGKDFKRVATQP